jgi:rRNA maturation endonuclease Nob1
MNDEFQCEACFHIGALDVHGACECCGSQRVISQALIQAVNAGASSSCTMSTVSR